MTPKWIAFITISGTDITERVKEFGEIEAKLISTHDEEFRFHSGVPVKCNVASAEAQNVVNA